jgi:hypothetical protein
VFKVPPEGASLGFICSLGCFVSRILLVSEKAQMNHSLLGLHTWLPLQATTWSSRLFGNWIVNCAQELCFGFAKSRGNAAPYYLWPIQNCVCRAQLGPGGELLLPGRITASSPSKGEFARRRAI